MRTDPTVERTLRHLAWLADRISDRENPWPLKDAALLAYNAAAMLQWGLVTTLNGSDVNPVGLTREQCLQAASEFSSGMERIVHTTDNVTPEQSKTLQKQIVARIEKVSTNMWWALCRGSMVPARMPELEKTIEVTELLEGYLAAHAETHKAEIEKGWLRAKKNDGPDAAMNQALAALIYTNSSACKSALPPDAQKSLQRMAAGFFKIAVDDLTAEDIAPAVKRRLSRRADMFKNAASHPDR